MLLGDKNGRWWGLGWVLDGGGMGRGFFRVLRLFSDLIDERFFYFSYVFLSINLMIVIDLIYYFKKSFFFYVLV